jgi:hypothetical protein
MANQIPVMARRLWRPLALGAGAILFAGLLAPFISAASFRGPIEQGLERSLGRKISFSGVRFTIFSGPGFLLHDVTIEENPRYGSEPFAYVPTLEARLRLDKLLLGRFVFASIRLDEPSLNLVKQTDGTWNVVDLMNRLSAPRRLPVSFIPALTISAARVNIKFGPRKTTLYLADSDFSLYTQRSGTLYAQFSGSPARTDRAGNGFGHFRGSASWFEHPDQNGKQVEADLILDQSNLSELTTLVEGKDLGVHGTVGSHFHLEGPATSLHLVGNLDIKDVHRWDLMPNKGEDWRIHYRGLIDLQAHRLDLQTSARGGAEPQPVTFQLRVNDFLKQPSWSVLLSFQRTPLEQILPLGRRLGLVLPSTLDLSGTVDGVLGYSSMNRLAGRLALSDFRATLPDSPPLRASNLLATVMPDRIHLDSAELQTEQGSVEVGGDYGLNEQGSSLRISMTDVPVQTMKRFLSSWPGDLTALDRLHSGRLLGSIAFNLSGNPETASTWSGQFGFTHASIVLPSLAVPLADAQGRVSFSPTTLDVEHIAGTIGDRNFLASYHYNALAKVPERLSVHLRETDLADVEQWMHPALQGSGLLVRLGVLRRAVPAWITERNLRADVTVDKLAIDGVMTGSLRTQLIWTGSSVRFPEVHLEVPESRIDGDGQVDISTNLPRLEFHGAVVGYPWRGGQLDAEGRIKTSGLGSEAMHALRGEGTFAGQNIGFAPEDNFSQISGSFQLSGTHGWPEMKFTDIAAAEGEGSWTGEGETREDGSLILQLEQEGHQRRVVSTISPQLLGAFLLKMAPAARRVSWDR